nr:MAG TPA: hypothetical protein [Caudoviricetes sp.]
MCKASFPYSLITNQAKYSHLRISFQVHQMKAFLDGYQLHFQ